MDQTAPVRTFKFNGEIFDVPTDKVDAFLSKAKGAEEVKSFVNEKDTFDVPVAKVDLFLKKLPTAKTLYETEVTPAPETPAPAEVKVQQQAEAPVEEKTIETPDKSKFLEGIKDPQEREIFGSALDKTFNWYKERGGLTPVDKINQFNVKMKDLEKTIKPESIANMSQEDIDKFEMNYQNQAKTIANELGLNVDDAGNVSVPENERQQFAEHLQFYTGVSAKENQEQKGFLENLFYKLSAGTQVLTANTIDVAGVLTGANYFKSFRNLSEGARLNADQLSAQANRYDDTIESYMKTGSPEKAIGAAVSGAFESLPSMIPVFASPTYGLAAMSAMSGIDKYRQLSNEDIPEWERVYNSAITAFSEYAGEKLVTIPILARSKQALLSLGETRGKEAIKQAVTKTVESNVSKVGKMPEWVAEGMSEVATGISTDIVDKVTYAPETKIGSHAGDDFVVGAVMGKMFSLPQDVAKFKDRMEVNKFSREILNKLPADMEISSKIDLGWKIAERDALVKAEEKLDDKFKGKYQERIISLNTDIDKISGDYAAKTKAEVSAEQDKIDYLLKQGVKIPNGTTMEQLDKLYQDEKIKSEQKAETISEKPKTELTETVQDKKTELSDIKTEAPVLPEIETAESLPKVATAENQGEQKLQEFKEVPFDKEAYRDLKEFSIGEEKFTVGEANTVGAGRVFIVEKDGVGDIGTATLSPDGTYLTNIRIDEKFRRQGIGSKVYDYIENTLGYKLKPSPDKMSPSAKNFWEKRTKYPEVKSEEVAPAELKDVVSTAKALKGKDITTIISPTEINKLNKQLYDDIIVKQKELLNKGVRDFENNPDVKAIKEQIKFSEALLKNDANAISKTYHKAKKDGSNPELVKAVETLLAKSKEATVAKEPTESGLGDIRELNIKEKSKALADSLRKAKFVQSMADLNKLQSDPTGLLKVAWDGSIEAAAKIIEASGSIANAINKAISTLKKSEWYKSLSESSRKTAEKQLKADINTAFASMKDEIKIKHERALKESIGEKRMDDVKKDLYIIAEELVELDKLKASKLKKGLTDYLKDTQGLTAEEKKLLVDEVLSDYKAKKGRPSGGASVEKKLKTVLDAAKAGKAATEKEFAAIGQTVAKALNEAVGKKFITPGQHRSIIRAIGQATSDRRTKFGEPLATRKEKLFAYVDKVLNEAEYKKNIASAKKVVDGIKDKNKKGQSKFGEAAPLATKLTEIDLTKLTVEELAEFTEIAGKILHSKKAPNAKTLEFVVAKFGDKTKDDLDKFRQKIDDAIANGTLEELKDQINKDFSDYFDETAKLFKNIKTAEDFIKAQRRANTIRRKLDKMLNEGIISESEAQVYLDKMNPDSKDNPNLANVYLNWEEAVKGWEADLSEFKKEYAQVLSDKAKSKETKDALKNLDKLEYDDNYRLMNATPDMLERLSIADLEAYNSVIESLQAGYTMPEGYALAEKLNTMKMRDSFLDKVVASILNSSTFKSFVGRGMTQRTSALIQKVKGQPPLKDNLEKAIGSAKANRLDKLLQGVKERYDRISVLYYNLANKMQIAENKKNEFEKRRIKMYEDFDKKFKGKNAADQRKKIANFFTEASWQNERHFKEDNVTPENASYLDRGLNNRSPKQKGLRDSAAFEADRDFYNSVFWAGAKDNNLTKDVNGVEVLDIEKYEAWLRKDAATGKLIDEIRQYLEDVKPYARVATMQNGRTFIEKEMYWPFRGKETGQDITKDGIIESMSGSAFFHPKMQANSTYNRTGAIEWLNNDIFSVLESHTNELMRNYYLYSESRATLQAIKESFDKAGETAGKEDVLTIAQLRDVLKGDITDRASMFYNKGKFQRDADRWIDNKLRAGKKGMLLSLGRPPAELAANLWRATWAIGRIPTKALTMSNTEKRVFDAILKNNVGDKYWSSYSAEIGQPSFKRKLLKKGENFADWWISTPDKLVGKVMYRYEFMRAFEQVAGKKFDAKEYESNKDYAIDNRDAMMKANAWALSRMEEMFNDKALLSTPPLTKFLMGTIKANSTKKRTKIFDTLQSYGRNETEQIGTAMERMQSDNAQDRWMGRRDMAAVIGSNIVYQSVRRSLQSAITIGLAGVLGQALSDYEEEEKDKPFFEKLKEDAIRGGMSLAMGGSSNIYGYIGKWAFYVSRDIIDDQETQEWINNNILEYLYMQKVPEYGSVESAMIAVLPVPNAMVRDAFDGVDGITAFLSAVQDRVNSGRVSEKQKWEIVNAINVGIKYFVPNIISPVVQKLINREIAKAKKREKEGVDTSYDGMTLPENMYDLDISEEELPDLNEINLPDYE